jgi:hypothetical protein
LWCGLSKVLAPFGPGFGMYMALKTRDSNHHSTLLTSCLAYRSAGIALMLSSPIMPEHRILSENGRITGVHFAEHLFEDSCNMQLLVSVRNFLQRQ